MEKRPVFTVKQGLEYQRQLLYKYGNILHKSAYLHLLDIVNRHNINSRYVTGYDVLRGTDIDLIVFNTLMKTKYIDSNE